MNTERFLPPPVGSHRTATTRFAAARELVKLMREDIPMARSMDVQLAECTEHLLSLSAPLAPNINDKGCAFGGSLVSLMTLAGWALVDLELHERGEACDVYVGESGIRYLAPLWQDFRGEARLAEGANWSVFFTALAERGKAPIDITCRVPGDDGAGTAATLSARFVAKRRR